MTADAEDLWSLPVDAPDPPMTEMLNSAMVSRSGGVRHAQVSQILHDVTGTADLSCAITRQGDLIVTCVDEQPARYVEALLQACPACRRTTVHRVAVGDVERWCVQSAWS